MYVMQFARLKILLRNRRQILLLILSELVNLHSTWNNQKSYDFLMISGGIEVS